MFKIGLFSDLGLDIPIVDKQERYKHLCVIEKQANYTPFFKVTSAGGQGTGSLSDHVPLTHDDVLSYNMLCPGSPNGLVYDHGEKYHEDRDYDQLNFRTIKNLKLIRRWIEDHGLALIQEVSLNIHAYFNEDVVDFLAFDLGRIRGCQFYQGTFYSKNYFEDHPELSSALQQKMDQVSSAYRPQQGRILTTILKKRTSPIQLIALINLHLAPGGRGEHQQQHFLAYMTKIIENGCRYMMKHQGRRIIIAGDLNADPQVLKQLILPKGWSGTLVYAPDSCQSYWDERPHWSTNDVILDIRSDD